MKKIIAILFLVTGCASQQQVVSEDPACLPDTPTGQVMQAARAVLAGMHFDIEKYDTDARYIRTRPLSGAQFFEIWRQDNTSASAAAQANLHSIRRIVELELTPQGTATCMQCRVQILRLSIPEAPLAGTGRMSGVYTDSDSRYQSLQVDNSNVAQIEWLDAGTDQSLERKILNMIREQIQKGGG
ncbi:MAG: hypothetical protein ABFR90_03920 [Planctomycetota bacterium]